MIATMPSLVFKTGGGRSSIAVLSRMHYRHFPGQMDQLKAALQDSAARRYAIGTR
ncbi:MAG: hypothetical protein GXC94_00845 [Comamonadaceae bacterium]|nr:hypothetical protein [Comamonadaceae bacterium]